MSPARTPVCPLPDLRQEHWEDLCGKSGLTAQTIQEAGIRSLDPQEWNQYLPRWLDDGPPNQPPPTNPPLRSCYVIPYPTLTGSEMPGQIEFIEEFYRVKLFPPRRMGDEHTLRYFQPSGSAPRLYVPPRVVPLLQDPEHRLLITEGEKKALRATQEGFPCVAIGGLWSWLYEHRPIPDLDQIDWCNRRVLLLPDSNVWTRGTELLEPVYALGRELADRGAAVEVVKLPALDRSRHGTGLDDFLQAGRRLEELGDPLTLKHTVFTKTVAWHKEWVKRRASRNGHVAEVAELLMREPVPRPLHPAQDVRDGVLWLGFNEDIYHVTVNSERRLYCDLSYIPEEGESLPDPPGERAPAAFTHRLPGDACFDKRAVLAWLQGERQGSLARAIDGLADYYGRYVVLRPDGNRLLLATWTLGTYCYRAFRYYPYVRIESATKRTGKSRLLDLMCRVAFNAPPGALTIPTEAFLFREAERTGGFQPFDEMENLKGDNERFEAVLAVLNTGFMANGVVSRMEKRDETFVSKLYNVYAPRALAAINAMKDNLEDRSIPITMLRRTSREPIERMNQATEARAKDLREECALACLTHIRAVLQAYEDMRTLLEAQEGIDDRAIDLWAPLLALAQAADQEDGGDRRRTLYSMLRGHAEMRNAEEAEANQTLRLINELDAYRERTGSEPTPQALLDAIRPRLSWITNVHQLGRVLSKLGVHRSRPGAHRGPRQWVYVLERDRLADLRTRYGGSENAEGT